MLNSKGQRQLAYIVRIDNIKPIEGADKVQLAIVGGWTIMVRKGQFKPMDLAVYFEIDSRVPQKQPFLFMQKCDYKVKTQKYFKGTVLSQGLLMSAEDFGWYTILDDAQFTNGEVKLVPVDIGGHHCGDFLTKELGVTYYEPQDNKRKAQPLNRFEKMHLAHKKLFKKHRFFEWMYSKQLGKKILYVFLKPRKKETDWPYWVVKTDEQRIQNIPHILQNTGEWIVTQKIDGSSSTYTYRKRGKGHGYYICSRNVVMNNGKEHQCYYDSDIYSQMSQKYNIESVLKEICQSYHLDWVTLQGQTYGKSVQKRDYGLNEHRLAGFNLIFSTCGRLNSCQAAKIMDKYGIPWVPIIDQDYRLPDTVEDMLTYAEGSSVIDGGMREGVVLRSQDGTKSFKAVSNKFLIKYHG